MEKFRRRVFDALEVSPNETGFERFLNIALFVLILLNVIAVVLETVESRLLTPLGLRSLAPGEPGYTARYQGSIAQRDGATFADCFAEYQSARSLSARTVALL